MHISTNAQICIHKDAETNIYIYIIYIDAHMQTRAHEKTDTITLVLTQKHTQKRKNKRTHANTNARTHANTNERTHAN